MGRARLEPYWREIRRGHLNLRSRVQESSDGEGAFKQVRETRIMFQDWMRPRFIEIVEDATGRKVRAFFSQVTRDPDMAVELFFFEPPQSSSDGGPPEVAGARSEQ
jgi:hypothetical protein